MDVIKHVELWSNALNRLKQLLTPRVKIGSWRGVEDAKWWRMGNQYIRAVWNLVI